MSFSWLCLMQFYDASCAAGRVNSTLHSFMDGWWMDDGWMDGWWMDGWMMDGYFFLSVGEVGLQQQSLDIFVHRHNKSGYTIKRNCTLSLHLSKKKNWCHFLWPHCHLVDVEHILNDWMNGSFQSYIIKNKTENLCDCSLKKQQTYFHPH